MRILMMLLLVTEVAFGQQVCRTEAEIPSTTPDARYLIDTNNGTVVDLDTELMWARCPLGKSGANCEIGSDAFYDLADSKSVTANSTLSGYINWRLPNIKELNDLVENRCFNPAVNLNAFPNVYQDGDSAASIFWSSTIENKLRFQNGETVILNSLNSYQVRMVRDMY